MIPQRGPRSQCAAGAKEKLRLTPSSRTTTFSVSSFPTGTDGCGRLGSSSSFSSRAVSRAPRSASSASRLALSAAPFPFASSRASGLGARAISLERRFCSAWMACESFFSLRTVSSRASTASRSTEAPSLRKPSRTSSEFSRMSRTSSMVGGVYAKGRACHQAARSRLHLRLARLPGREPFGFEHALVVRIGRLLLRLHTVRARQRPVGPRDVSQAIGLSEVTLLAADLGVPLGHGRPQLRQLRRPHETVDYVCHLPLSIGKKGKNLQ